ncbi:hypothetical protein H2203_003681 [Taxawa tesnikishii (nom. ined.)]|nr:hypothetical protein H2203_003681 [Dothideales sp. JES 119]
MHFSTITAAGLLSLAASAAAAVVKVQNNCNTVKWLSITRTNQSMTQQALAAGGSFYSEPLVGSGNSFGITNNPDYYNAATGKLILGWSVGNNLQYWTVSNSDPYDPQAGRGFVVHESDPGCTQATTYDGAVHTCSTSSDLTLFLC